MPRNLIPLLLLTAFGLGFTAGIHPCEAVHGEELSRHASCHETGSSTGPSLRAAPASHGGQDCCDTLCRHSCHMAAVAELRPVAFTVAPACQMAAQPADRILAPLSHAIDHVPLA